MFHIHLNALCLDDHAAQELKHIGFERRDFEPGQLGASHFVPKIHLMNHQIRSNSFKTTFFQARRILSQDSIFVGYLEGEHVAAECTIETPQQITSLQMDSAPKFHILFQAPREWRESEIHISLSDSAANAAILAYLLEKGFYRAQCRKPEGIFNVLTVQGHHRVIQEVYERVQTRARHFSAGCMIRMKIERSAGHYLSPGFTWVPMQACAIIDEQRA